MITKKELDKLYQWGKSIDIPYKIAPTAMGYSNKPISYCWIKGESVKKNGDSSVKYMRKRVIKNEEVEKIFDNSEIIFVTFALFDEGTILQKHKDPNIYREEYKRIQIPLTIPNEEKCYMIWKDEKLHWSEGKPQIFEVMDHIHEGGNLCDSPMEFLFLDVKKDTEVEL
jgi:hypothetical protein